MGTESRKPVRIEDLGRRITEHFLHTLLIAQANEGCSGAKIASTILVKTRPVGVGQNTYKTSPFQKRFARNELAICMHAETGAIRNALRNVSVDDLDGSTMLIARVKKTGEFGLAKPCSGCMRAIAEFNIGRVIYTTNQDGYVQDLF